MVHFYCWDPHSEVMECEESPVRLGIVSAQLLPEDPVTSWGGQKAGLPLRSTPELHFLNLNSHLRGQSNSDSSNTEQMSSGECVRQHVTCCC